MSDNGGTTGVKLFNAGMRGRKNQVYDGGHRVPFFVHWPNGTLKHGEDVHDLTAHIDVLPTLIDLCDLSPERKVDFDGRSFKRQLFQLDSALPERTLFVETQRTIEPKAWAKTAGLTKRWRLVNNKELYDMTKDPGQETNVIKQHPEVVREIQVAHKAYWERVSPGDRDKPRFIVGHPNDPETFLQPADWYLPSVPWNHAEVAQGKTFIGAWDIAIADEGTYRFEVRRWPREADAPIQGVPVFEKGVDAWDAKGGKDGLIYGGKMKALPVDAIALEVGDFSDVQQVSSKDKQVVFDIPLKQGATQVKGAMLDPKGKTIAGAYYIYVKRLLLEKAQESNTAMDSDKKGLRVKGLRVSLNQPRIGGDARKGYDAREAAVRWPESPISATARNSEAVPRVESTGRSWTPIARKLGIRVYLIDQW